MYSFAHYALPLVGLPFYPSVARALFLDRILPQSCLDISLTRFQESGILEKIYGSCMWQQYRYMLPVLSYRLDPLWGASFLFSYLLCSISLHHHSHHDCKRRVGITAVFTALFQYFCAVSWIFTIFSNSIVDHETGNILCRTFSRSLCWCVYGRLPHYGIQMWAPGVLRSGLKFRIIHGLGSKLSETISMAIILDDTSHMFTVGKYEYRNRMLIHLLSQFKDELSSTSWSTLSSQAGTQYSWSSQDFFPTLWAVMIWYWIWTMKCLFKVVILMCFRVITSLGGIRQPNALYLILDIESLGGLPM